MIAQFFFHIDYGSNNPNSEKLDESWIVVHVYSLFNVKCYQDNYFLNDTSTSWLIEFIYDFTL